MSTHNLPPLATLLAFEAVARRRSFALAATELHLSASAISHQIAKLEGQLGTKLLNRTTAGVHLNSAGEYYLQRVQAALGTLMVATKDVKKGVRKSLSVHVSPSFGSLWLMPRLSGFASEYPDISLQLTASHMHSDFAIGQIDLEVRYGAPRWPNLKVAPLFKEKITAMASPLLMKRLKLKHPREIFKAPLIQSTVNLVQWADWLSAQDVDERPSTFSLRFDRAQLALDAAVQGLGIALESTTIAASHIHNKRLLPVFTQAQSVEVEGHFVVYPEHHANRPEVKAFVDWLSTQTKNKNTL